MNEVSIGLVHRLVRHVRNREDATKHWVLVGSVLFVECSKDVIAHSGDDVAQVFAQIDDESIGAFALNRSFESEGHVSPVASWPRGRVRADGKHQALLFLSNHSKRRRDPSRAHRA